MSSPWMTILECSQFMGVSVSYVRTLVRDHRLEVARQGRIIRIHKTAASAFLLFGTGRQKLTRPQKQIINDLNEAS